MSVIITLQERGEGKCELCGATDDLDIYEVPPAPTANEEDSVLTCKKCRAQLESTEGLDVHHWQCLQTSAWSQVPPVQVVAWRMLNRLNDESWARDLLDMLYLEDDVLAWAQSGAEKSEDVPDIKHLDSNGAVLLAGDTVVLIKDLTVKGAGFTAKRGTAVRSISLVPDNAEQIEGRVNGQQIVILTKFVKK